MNINDNEEEFSFFSSNEYGDEDNQQLSFLTDFEEAEPIQLSGIEDFCQHCYQQQGFHYADVDRRLFLCDDCFNRYFSIDLVIPPPYSK